LRGGFPVLVSLVNSLSMRPMNRETVRWPGGSDRLLTEQLRELG